MRMHGVDIRLVPGHFQPED